MEHYDLSKASEELMKADRLLRNYSTFPGLKYRARI
jgi:hypothetical protein